jgi:hypothetical protein
LTNGGAIALCRSRPHHFAVEIAPQAFTDKPNTRYTLAVPHTHSFLNMNSRDLGRYLEQTESFSKPWLLAQLRLLKLKEEQSNLSIDEYEERLSDIHQDLMNLGEWWVGIEDEVF